VPIPSAQTLRCPSCGAPAASGAAACAYCRSQLATVSCPSCFGLLFDGGAFCQRCGAARSRTRTKTEQLVKCPGCASATAWVRVGEADLLECAKCVGTWVEADTFEGICASRESQAALLHTPRGAAPADTKTQRVRYRRCPRCRKMMNRVNFGKSSGAVVDVCKGHGTFLDRGELHQIVRFIQGGGIDRARAAEQEQLKEEQRRLRDLQRDQARLSASTSASPWNDRTLSDFLSALLDRV
jgi:Zn-finger nucleic acid-binding protein